MASWRINNGFIPLNEKLRAKYPHIVIYDIGDTAHAATKSDHNPNKYGRVNAQDYMLRNEYGFDHANAIWLCSWLIKDPRTKYVIFNRRIWENGEWKYYDGKNPHTDHVHHSLYDNADTNRSEWQLEKKVESDVDIDDALKSTPFANGGGSHTPIGDAVLNSSYPKTVDAPRTPAWANLRDMQEDITTLMDMMKTLTAKIDAATK